jgi:hypothetical protein
MTFIQFLALFLIVGTLVLVVAYGFAQSRKVKLEADKKNLSRYFITLVITFMAGGIIRIIQQINGFEWLDGFVTILGGLFVLLWSVPLFWGINQNKIRGLKRLLSFMLGLFIALVGLGIIYLGIVQVNPIFP